MAIAVSEGHALEVGETGDRPVLRLVARVPRLEDIYQALWTAVRQLNPQRIRSVPKLHGVADEKVWAADFVPSQRTVASSEPIMRAAAQLRKYGYGIIVATQEPKSIHNQVVANCGTQVFGRALAPATQDAMRGMMQQLGAAPGSVGTLKPGEFFVSVPEAPTPQKIRTHLCLAHHGSAATPDEVRSLARASRDLR
jgi:hypothetical protein